MSDSLTTKFIEIQGVEQTFKTRTGQFCALRNIDLTVARGEFVSLIGHSGCGKSTLLNLIAGLTTVTKGAVLLENQEVNAPGPDRAVVFQQFALFPWKTVWENIDFGLKCKGFPAAERGQHIKRFIELMSLNG